MRMQENLIVVLSLFSFISLVHPIEVLSVLPGPLSQSQTQVLLQNYDPITVVYGAPVISLGADWGSTASLNVPFQLGDINVPGNIRWVTTSIARFDPLIPWPTDLSFTLQFFPLAGPQGDVVDTTPPTFSYFTGPPTLYLSSVSSELASNLTDGVWQSSYPSFQQDSSFLYEVPPDGKITIYFGSFVDTERIAAALEITSSLSGAVSFTHENCSTQNCMVIVPYGLSGDYQTYSIILPAGSQTSQYSGKTKTDVILQFSGLYPFEFSLSANQGPSSKILALYLRHGLQGGVNSLSELSKFISISPQIAFTLDLPYSWMLTLNANFTPSTTYTLSITSSLTVKDGFGLSLQGSSVNFTMMPRASLFVHPEGENGYAVFEDFPQNQNWTIFSRDPDSSFCSPPRFVVSNVNQNNIADAIYSFTDNTVSHMTGTTYSVPKSTSGLLDITTFSPPIQNTGLWLTERFECYGNAFSQTTVKSSSWMSRNNFAVTVLAGAEEIIVWVTQTNASVKIAGAHVEIYGYSTSSLGVSKLVGNSFTTDSNGLVKIDITGLDFSSTYQYTAFAVVTSGGLIQISSSFFLYSYTPSFPDYIWALITDRALYSPGETVNIKGYIRQRDHTTISVLSSASFSLYVQWNSDTSGKYNLDVSPSGTYYLSVPIPANATTSTTATLQVTSLDSSFPYMSTDITIATPRIPTVSLSVSTAEVIYKPQSTIPLKISLATYAGTPVSNGVVDLTWQIESQPPPFRFADYFYGLEALSPSTSLSSQILYSGEAIATLNDSGELYYELQINATALEGNTIKITGSFMSPTKEVVTDSFTLPVAFSSLSLCLKPTISGVILPKYNFGVFAGIQDLANNGATVPGVEVTVQLYTWDGISSPVINNQTGKATIAGSPVGTPCTFVSVDGGINPGCTGLALPDIGQYLLVGTALDSNSYTVTTIVPVGYNLTQWENSPLSSNNDIQFTLDKDTYNENDVVTVSFYNPYPTALVLLRWGIYPDSKTLVSEENRGDTKITFQFSSECELGCMLDIVVAAPRDSSASGSSVPTSILYDPLGPSYTTNSIPLVVIVPPRNINVTVEYDQIVQPGQQTTMIISLNKDNQLVSGEVAVFVVDKANLDLMPNPVTKFNETLTSYSPASDAYYSIFDSRDFLASLKGYQDAVEIIKRRLEADPWYIPDSWPLQPSNGLNPLDVSDDTFFAYYKYAITDFPNSFPPPPWQPRVFPLFFGMSAGAALDAVAVRQDVQTPNQGSTQMTYLRTNFLTSPLFVGRALVDKNSPLNITYTMPDNIGTFEIRVYAIDDNSDFGVAVEEQISRRPFSLQASAPRIVRYGDNFTAGVSVTIADPAFSGYLTVQVDRICQILAMAGSAVQQVMLTGSGPHLVNFNFMAIGIGSANLEYKVFTPVDASNSNAVQLDAVLVIQDVVGQQEPVFIATSMAVSGGESTEGFMVPDAVPYSGNLSIAAGVGRLPAIYFLTDYSSKLIANPSYASADSFLANLVPSIVLSKYGVSLASSRFSTSLSMLNIYTDNNAGLQMIQPQSYFSKYTDPHLQAFGLFVLSEAQKVSSLGAANGNLMNGLSTIWKSAMLSKMASDAQDSRIYGNRYNDFNTIAFAYLALGTKPLPFTSDITADIQSDFALSRLIQSNDSLSMDAKAALCLALLRDNVEASTSSLLIKELTNSIRVQGRTAYISDPNSQNPNFLATAIGLEAFVKQQNDSPLVEKIANFVAQDDQYQQRWWFAGEQLSHFMISLAAYDTWKHNNMPNLNLAVTSASQNLLAATFTGASQIPAQTSLYFESLNSSIINFTACCVGEASVVFGASFVPRLIPENATYRGIIINRVIQLADPNTYEPTGGPILQASIGQRVVTTIQVTLPDYSTSAVIVDPFPGALEPLDDSVYNLPQSAPIGWSFRWWSYINAFSTKAFLKDKVVFYGQNLYGGTHSVRYYSIVTTEGKFVLPPTLVYDAFQPEVMGLTEGGYFTTQGYVASDVVVGGICLPWERPDIAQSVVSSNDNSQPNMETNNLALGLGIGLGVGLAILIIAAALFIAQRLNRVPTTTITTVPTIT